MILQIPFTIWKKYGTWNKALQEELPRLLESMPAHPQLARIIVDDYVGGGLIGNRTSMAYFRHPTLKDVCCCRESSEGRLLDMLIFICPYTTDHILTLVDWCAEHGLNTKNYCSLRFADSELTDLPC